MLSVSFYSELDVEDLRGDKRFVLMKGNNRHVFEEIFQRDRVLQKIRCNAE